MKKWRKRWGNTGVQYNFMMWISIGVGGISTSVPVQLYKIITNNMPKTYQKIIIWYKTKGENEAVSLGICTRIWKKEYSFSSNIMYQFFFEVICISDLLIVFWSLCFLTVYTVFYAQAGISFELFISKATLIFWQLQGYLLLDIKKCLLLRCNF